MLKSEEMGLSWHRAIESQELGLGLVAGIFLFSVGYFTMYSHWTTPFVSALSVPTIPTGHVPEVMSSRQLGPEVVASESKLGCNGCKEADAIRLHGGSISSAYNAKELEHRRDDGGKPKRNPICDFSNMRFDICEMYGDIRIDGNDTRILFVDSSRRNESWRIKPYPRKLDGMAMANVREVATETLHGYERPPLCTLNHSATAIVFSVAGYTGNYFHDFSDVLIPLFITSYQFSGEVQFLVSGIRSWWIERYLPVFSKLSAYRIIDFDVDDQVHCFRHAIVGLRSHKELSIDPSRSPNGYSLSDFAKFLKTAFSLPRQYLNPVAEHSSSKRPRLLLVARNRTRTFTNLGKIVRMAKKVGYKVVVTEADSGSNVTQFARLVNSCDVMMGVHGAGLTNILFLPTNAVAIQIVPLGRLESIANDDFGVPAADMKLKYLEYSIAEDESTLLDLYPRDHPVFKDPLSFHMLGWNAMSEIYLNKQNVRLNVKRFRQVLLQALEHLQSIRI